MLMICDVSCPKMNNQQHSCLSVQDVAYYFAPSKDCFVTISLCNTSTTPEPLDTVIFLLEDLHANPVASTTCNGDFCGRYSQLSVRTSLPFKLLTAKKTTWY